MGAMYESQFTGKITADIVSRCPSIYPLLLHVWHPRRTSLDKQSVSSNMRSSQCLHWMAFDQRLLEFRPYNGLLHRQPI
jgi:hypothetical protein